MPAGRPETPIDWDRVDIMLLAGCSVVSIADEFGLSDQTLHLRFKKEFGINFIDYKSKMYIKGCDTLKEAQYKKALGITEKGDNTLLIWLGKCRLKQREEAAQEDSNSEILKKFEDLMDQFSARQSQAKASDNISNTDNKSV